MPARIQLSKWRDTARNTGGALYFAALALVSLLRWNEFGRVFFGLLAFRAAAIAVLLFIRRPALIQGGNFQSFVAFIAMSLPVLYSSRPGAASVTLAALADCLAVLGYLLATLAAIELGNRMGATPAYRGEVCRSGVYRWFKHPMYIGYGIAELGWVVLDPSNIGIFMISTSLQFLRARWESHVLRVGSTTRLAS